MLYDLVNQCVVSGGLAPAVLAASAQGASADFSNGHVSTNAVVQVGAVSAGNTNLQVQIEESDTGTSGWTVISGMVQSAVTTSGVYLLRGNRAKRYVRANAVSVQGTTPTIAVGCVIIAEKKYMGSPQTGYSRLPST